MEKNNKKKMEIKLLDCIHLTGIIVCKTGLAIGAGEGFGIGEISRFVVKDSFRDNLPYIPGSSLKGKMRHLFELKYLVGIDDPDKRERYFLDKDGNPHSCDMADCPICIIFGPGKPEDNKNRHRGPTRLIVRDAPLDNEDQIKDFGERTGSFTEVKAENVINRLDGTAMPRWFERVPAGMQFKLDMVYRIFDLNGYKENPDEIEESDAENNKDIIRTAEQDREDFKYVLQALSLVQQDYLGSSGSRGYGRVKFVLFEPSKNDHTELIKSILEADKTIDIDLIKKPDSFVLFDDEQNLLKMKNEQQEQADEN